MGAISESTGPFDYLGVLAAIEAERQRRGLSKTALLKDIAETAPAKFLGSPTWGAPRP